MATLCAYLPIVTPKSTRVPINQLTGGKFQAKTNYNVVQRSVKSRRHGRVQVSARVATAPANLKDSLQYRQLGESDLVISEVTLGTMTWGNQNTEQEAHDQLCYAFDNGVNILDTAEMYPVPPKAEYQGSTDRYVATWLKSMPRDKVILATKVAGYAPHLKYLRDNGEGPRVDAANISESVEKSLKRLGTDHIDLLQIHWPDRYVPLFGEYEYRAEKERQAVGFEEQLKALQEMVTSGKVRHIGVSNETSFGVMEFIRAAESSGLPRIVSIQNSYSLLVRTRFEVDLVEVCRKVNVGLLAYSPLAGGSLSGKYLDPTSDAAKTGRFNVFPGYMGRFNKSLAIQAVAEYAQVAAKYGLTPAQLALAFVRDRWFVASNIIGATSVEQLKENLSAYTLPRSLKQEINEEIEKIFARFRDPSLLD